MPLPNKLPVDFDKHISQSRDVDSQLVGGRYLPVKRIGSGNFGTAVLVKDQSEKNEKEKLKVLKQITVGPLDPGETVDAMREAKLLSQMKHKNIVQFHASFLDGNYFCIIIEYCEGGDLDCKLQEEKRLNQLIPELQVIKWMKQLLRAIDYMHRKRILHRDLKTRNIFLKDNQVKIGDFGISRILLGASDKASTFVGTPYYMSPEVLKHDQYDEKCDIWSLGCVLFEICCFEHAFDGGTLMSVMMKIVSDHKPSLPEYYSRGLSNVLDSMLDRSPARRQTAARLLRHPVFESCVESERHLTARDRLRMKKQKEADSKMQKLKEMAKLQVVENNKLRRESKERNFTKSSFGTNMRLVEAPEMMSKSKLLVAEDDPEMELHGTVVFQPVEENNSARDSAPTLKPPSDDDVDISTLTGCIEKTPQAEDLNNTDELIKSLIRDGVIPEDAELADTFYSSNDDFEIVTSSSDEGERLPDEDIDLSRTEFVDLMGLMEGVLDLDGSTVARSSGTKHAGHSPKPGFEEQYNLKRSDTSRAQQNPHVGEDDAEKTVVGFSVFHANVIENKISKMLEKCRSGVDPGVFEKGYEMMKQIKHDDSASHEENMKIIEEVKKLIPDRNKCMDMEQLVYMEEQLRMNPT